MKTYLRQYPHSGLEIPATQYDDEADGRKAAAKLIRRRRRQGLPIVKIGDLTWEVMEPDDCNMIPDACGIIHLAMEPKRECPECGWRYYPSENPDGCDCLRPVEDEEEEIEPGDPDENFWPGDADHAEHCGEN